jgi:hypothetical protein
MRQRDRRYYDAGGHVATSVFLLLCLVFIVSVAALIML